MSEHSPHRAATVRIVAVIIIAAVLISLSEAVVYFAAGPLLKAKTPFLFYDPPVEQAVSNFDDYLAKRHPQLGWPSRSSYGKDPFDNSGSRITPAFPTPGQACVSIYGDSFVFGEEVGHAQSWGNVLSELLNCRVANYGVGGYGTDQAYLRFLTNENDEADTVILGIFPHDLQRNVNQYRPLLVGSNTGNVYGLKPRLVLSESGKLELIPLPTPSKEDFLRMVKDPATFLTHEYFLPGTKAGPIRFQFPYTWFLIKAFLQAEIQASLVAKFRGTPAWTDYAAPDHPSQSYEVTSAIASEFAQQAAHRGKRALVLFFPTPSAVKQFKKQNKWAYQKLADSMAENNVTVLNAGTYMLRKLGQRDFCELVTSQNSCTGHFNEEGNRMLAELVREELAIGMSGGGPVSQLSPRAGGK
jgi:hypothetical protein